jgi:glycosyltransferase involved in cell wall biosynthesis
MVSVCVATYNGSKYIKEQLDSILIQLTENDEIIVSDDCSTDNTLEIIREYQDERIKIIINNGLKGHTYNFENAIKNASGDYIFFSDQDDVWLPGKVEKLLSLLENYSAVFSDAIVVDENLNPLYNSFFVERRVGRGIIKNFFKNTYFGFGMAFRIDLIKYAIPFPVQNEMGHDMI